MGKFISENNLRESWKYIDDLKQDKLPEGKNGQVLTATNDGIVWKDNEVSVDVSIKSKNNADYLEAGEDNNYNNYRGSSDKLSVILGNSNNFKTVGLVIGNSNSIDDSTDGIFIGNKNKEELEGTNNIIIGNENNIYRSADSGDAECGQKNCIILGYGNVLTGYSNMTYPVNDIMIGSNLTTNHTDYNANKQIAFGWNNKPSSNTFLSIGDGSGENILEISKNGSMIIPDTQNSSQKINVQDSLSSLSTKVDNTPAMWTGTKEEYDAIDQKDANTFYFIKEEV